MVRNMETVKQNTGKLDLEKDFRLFLQSEFLRRVKSNPSYSLRAFSSASGIDHTTLSRIIRGKRKITKKMIQKIGNSLGLAPEQMEQFLGGSVNKSKGPVAESSEDYKQLTIDAFHVISDWYHFAIKDLMLTTTFKSEPRWIAKRLSISVSEVHIAIERMLRLGLLKKDENGELKAGDSKNLSTIGMNYTNSALQKVQKQYLEKAMDALENVPFEKRDQSGMTMAINPRHMDEAKELIKDFRRKLCECMESRDDLSEVYQLNISFYPLTKSERSMEES